MKILPTAPLALAVLLIAAPAVAQDRSGPTFAAGAAEGGGRRAPSLVDGIEDPVTLLRLAGSAIAERRLHEATDLLERAEARLLTRSELATEADRPAGGAIGPMAAARDALARRDPEGARHLIGEAIGRLQSGETASVAVLPPAPAPEPMKPGLAPPVPPIMPYTSLPPQKPPPL